MTKAAGTMGLTRSSETSIEPVEFNRILQAFEADPGAGETAHRKAIKPVIDNLLHACRRQHRHHHIDEIEFGLMRGR